MTFYIDRKPIGSKFPPFIIAEMSGNHNQSLERALAIVDAAAEAGAHAIKLQTYTAETMTMDIKGGNFEINDEVSKCLIKGKKVLTNFLEENTNFQKIKEGRFLIAIFSNKPIAICSVENCFLKPKRVFNL